MGILQLPVIHETETILLTLQETVVEKDVEFVKDYYEMPDDAIDIKRLSPWLLRIVLDRAMLLDKKLSVADVAERINNEFEDELSCIFNDDNALQQVLRVSLRFRRPFCKSCLPSIVGDCTNGDLLVGIRF